MAPTETTRLDLPVQGMTCASCASRIERNLNNLDGVDATVNFATERASVSYDPGAVQPEQLLGAVEDAGYEAELPPPPGTPSTASGPAEGDPAERELRDLRTRLIVAGVLSIPILLIAMVPAFQFDYWQWLSLQLATPVVLWAGWPFHRTAWQKLRHGQASMDTLISLGTLTAFIWSVVALFFLGAGEPDMRMSFQLIPEQGAGTEEIYFEVAAVVTTFILAGRYFEARAKRRAGSALRALLELGAKEASVVDEDGSERLIAIDDLKVGQLFAVRPGEKIATDGEVVQGRSAVDNSLLTPVLQRPLELGDDQLRRPAGRSGHPGRRGHGPGADREAGDRGAVRQGARAAPGRSHLGDLRPDRHRPRDRDAGLLARRRREHRVRVHGRRPHPAAQQPIPAQPGPN